MKRILLYVLGIGLLLGLGYWATHTGSTLEVHNPESTPSVKKEPELTPEELMEQATQKLIANAVAASSTAIETAKKAAADKVENEMKLKIENQVRDSIAKTNDKRQQEIEKQLSF